MSDKYEIFDSETFPYYDESQFEDGKHKYLLNKYSPYATWDYEDSVELSFNLLDLGVDEEILEDPDKIILVKFYNSRYEPFYKKIELPCQEEIEVAISYDDSVRYFNRGSYHCSLQIVEYDDEQEIIYCQTVLSNTNCFLYVK